ncbi:glutamine--fructose-6-phosphate aminotransferase [isomerizing] 2-like isoform X2 [Tigriopus californicus]|uniref:glutamine--fructose-6-phosphate aminotransferase [isomerizing] 2-like isoform X2 n=1 Tax=Tigriopus californicus TaxID=6832 RepID=UPI0027DA60C2|nr:glutamine--fructose-6-phosphate aminotransferase [isomerizing] 2-like isoform X2 [Tigriopus californicus]
MCGICGCVFFNSSVTSLELLRQLQQNMARMEYRGYDSCGAAIQCQYRDGDPGIELFKAVGSPSERFWPVVEAGIDQINPGLIQPIQLGMGHTRWATHGEAGVPNCHPHVSSDKREFVVVHNGQITNFAQIRNYLKAQRNWDFYSETDTEVIPKLALYFYEQTPNATFPDVVEQVCQVLDGAYALIFMSSLFPNEVVATKCGSPLIIGVKSDSRLHLSDCRTSLKNGAAEAGYQLDEPNHMIYKPSDSKSKPNVQYYFSSDRPALGGITSYCLDLHDFDIAHARGNGELEISYKYPGSIADRHLKYQEFDQISEEENTFSCKTEQEIHQQRSTIESAVRGRVDFDNHTVKLGGIQAYLHEIRRSNRIYMIGMGTSIHAALATQHVLTSLTNKSVSVVQATQFIDMGEPIAKTDLCIFISQSGETADTKAALDYCNRAGALTLGITNVVGSSICQNTTCGIHVNAGVEVGVASTKAYTSQYICLVLLGIAIAQDFFSMKGQIREIIDGLRELPMKAEEVLNNKQQLKALVELIQECQNVVKECMMFNTDRSNSLYILGRGYQYAVAREAALKIKEIAYMHAEGLCSSELKHGPLAMVQENFPVILFAVNDQFKTHAFNAMNQLVSRGCVPYLIITEGDEVELENNFKNKAEVPFHFVLPKSTPCLQGILAVIPMQLLSLYLAQARGCNVDQPRNLAKSVTV